MVVAMEVEGNPEIKIKKKKMKKKEMKENKNVNEEKKPAVKRKASEEADESAPKPKKAHKKNIKDKKNDESEPKKEFVKLNKKETREKQKKDKAERKTKRLQEDTFTIGVKAKGIWEELRKELCSDEEKLKLSGELHSLVKDHLLKLVFAHDTVRVVECLMAYGSQEIRDKIFNELKEHIKDMSKSLYAQFMVHKFLKYGTKEQKEIIFKAFEARVATLTKHKIAGNVVELLYNDYANAEQRNKMLQEFLGPEFRLFKEGEVRTVEELVKKHPEKKTDIVKHLAANVEVLVKKGCFNLSLAHTVLHNYLSVVGPGEVRAAFISSIKENLIHVLHSREGALLSMKVLWWGTVKDRKSVIKSIKGLVEKTALEEYGHLVLLAIFDCVDDTKLVGKAVLGELLGDSDAWGRVVGNKYGLRVVKYLMAGRDTSYTYPDTLKMLTETGGDTTEHTKKEAAVRRRELVDVVAPQAIRWLGENVTTGWNAGPMTITFAAIFNNLPHSEQLSKVWELLAEEACKPFLEGDANIVESGSGNLLLKKIIIKDKERNSQEEGSPVFCRVLLNILGEDGLDCWLRCNRGAFLLVFCWETEIPEIQSKIRELLQPFAKVIRQKKSKGLEILSKKLEV